MSRKRYLAALLVESGPGREPDVGKRARSMENSGLSRFKEEYQERKNMGGLTPPPGAEDAIQPIKPFILKMDLWKELISHSFWR